MRVGLIVEGPFDEAVLYNIVRKILAADFEQISRWVDRDLWGKFKRGESYTQLRGYVKMLVAHGCSLIVIVWDNEGEEKGKRLNRLRGQIERLDEEAILHPPIAYGIAVQALEAWLLADINAVRRVLEVRIDAVDDPTDEIPDPKDRLRKIVSESSLRSSYTEIARSISAELDIEIASRHSRSLRQFRKDFPKP